MNKRVIEFACFIAKLTHSKLTGVFIEEPYFELVPSDETVFPSSSSEKVEKESITLELIHHSDKAMVSFREVCKQNGADCEIYQDNGNPIDEVINESRFADLMIVDPGLTYNKNTEAIPTHFLKEVLTRTECPVIIAPNVFEDIDHVVFCYDAGKSSVFAIKLFTYLFPEFKDKKVTLLNINHSGEEEDEGHKKMQAWLASHYSSVQLRFLDGDVKDEIFSYFFMKSKMLVVMGAYGRSTLSNFFKHSTAEELIRIVDLPLFIAHM
jgi:hypothetical protein